MWPFKKRAAPARNAEAGPSGAPSGAPGLDDPDVREAVEHEVRWRIAAAFDPPGEVVSTILESMVGDLDPERDRAAVERLVAQAARTHADAAATWPETTDNDRLDRAFGALESAGLVALQNAPCCSNCAILEVADEMQGRGARGGVWYHEQDTQSAIDGGSLYIGFLAAEEGEAAQLAIGRQAADALGAAGLEFDWDGDVAMKIRVHVDWKRRL